MNINMLGAFFMWCAIINAGLLILMSLLLAFAGNWIYRLHTLWFPMPRETFNTVIYSFLGLYKILILVFNAVPYAALLIIT